MKNNFCMISFLNNSWLINIIATKTTTTTTKRAKLQKI